MSRITISPAARDFVTIDLRSFRYVWFHEWTYWPVPAFHTGATGSRLFHEIGIRRTL